MLLHPHPLDEELAEKFGQAEKYWNLEKLYLDLAAAKQKERLRQRKQLTLTEKACLRGLLCGCSPTEIAIALKREPNGFRVDLSRGLYRYIEILTGCRLQNWTNVSKQLETVGYKLHDGVNGNGRSPTHTKQSKSVVTSTQHQNWGEAIDVAIFYGRSSELTILNQWLQARCRLIAILGMGGIGKTALSVKIAQEVQDEFEFLIWRSLRDAPPIEELLTTLIGLLSQQQETHLPQTVSGKVSQLIDYLSASRCLLVLDNFDTVLASGTRVGSYRQGYEGYGEMLHQIGERPHQSCLILTSREKPAEVAALQGEILPVRALQLKGLQIADAQAVLNAKGLVGSTADTQKLVECYQGNPLALKIAATSIHDLFDNNLTDFFEQGTTVFNGIGNLLAQQVSRLPAVEKKIMFWIAINREPVSAIELRADIVPTISRPELLEALESLRGRSLVEYTPAGFTQQPVVMEYMTKQLIERIYVELTGEMGNATKMTSFLQTYALVKATAKDYIRESQIRTISEPIAEKLRADFASQEDIESQFKQILTDLQAKSQANSAMSSYAAGNLLNLLRQLKVDLTDCDLSKLRIWQAYLQDVN